ncbi:hypothetical protein LTR72_011472 [Exophiala xenobiotica]|nr:hypothetical protein LTR72_011472 [Exophiala xenobiotica]KAK5284819.1 hypothetical protein LTR14_011473 [Exophiala xenobiotica]KAK5310841.1 hypothetical protein LTR93_011918 [Exophiala xenobiotica]KAK5468980.1 hypothetical protein LTR55_011492 [Exophiala xenobiotica]
MALSINLSRDEGKPFTPGSMVLGVVKFTTYEDRNIESLNIDFKGVAKAFLNQNYGDLVVSRTDYVSKSYLFSRHLDLYRGEAPRAVPPGSKESFYPKHPWKGDLALSAHPLPPSMNQNGKFVCTVQYGLEATLVHSPAATTQAKSRSEKKQASRIVPVESLDMSSNTHSGDDWPYTIHRHTMYFPLADSSYRPARRLFQSFSRNGQHDVPRTEMVFSVLLPKKLETKKPQTLSVPTSCRQGNSTAAHRVALSAVELWPDLVVHSIKLSLLQHTQVRAGCHTSSSTRRIFSRKGSCTVPISCMDPSASQTATNSLTSSFNLCDAMDLSISADLLAADFSTYNIARSHSLEVRFCVKYENKKHQIALRNIPIRVVPPSGRELDRRLSEGVEEDDRYGCYLAGIQWQDYQGNTSGTEVHAEAGEFLQAVMESSGGHGDLAPGTPPPAYTA